MQSQTHGHPNTCDTLTHSHKYIHTHNQIESHTQVSLDIILNFARALESLDLVNSCLLSFWFCDATSLSIICKMETQMPPIQGDQGDVVRSCVESTLQPGGADCSSPCPCPSPIPFLMFLPSKFYWALKLQVKFCLLHEAFLDFHL